MVTSLESRAFVTLGYWDPQGISERVQPTTKTVNASTPVRTALEGLDAQIPKAVRY